MRQQLTAILTTILLVAGVSSARAAATIDATAAIPATVPPGVATPVLITATINDPNVIATGLNLLKTDATGKTLATLGVMKDDGTSGDRTAGDSIFSFQITISEATPTTVYFRVSAPFKGVLLRTLSPVIPVVVQASSTPPSIQVTLAPSANANGWNSSVVTAHFVCTPGSAAIVSCPADQTFATDGAGQTASGTVTDAAGATASITSAPFSIDQQVPTIQSSTTPPANANGWHKAAVSVQFTCNDALSGIDSCTSAVSLTNEGASQNASGTATDRAGNTASMQVSVNIDLTPPTIRADASAISGGGTLVTFTCQDALSGIAACPPPQTIAAGGSTHVHGETADRAGNVAGVDLDLVVDNTPPSIQLTAAPPANSQGWNNSPVTITFQCNDADSGIAQCPAPQTIDTEGANQSVSGTARDNAGNEATASTTLSIDLTPPTLTVNSPLDGAVVSQVNITVSGSVADAASGVASIACNGTPANLSGSSFSCAMTLGTGTTGIAVVATDRAGNTTTRTFTVTLGGNFGPTAAHGGPYSGVAGTAVVFNGAGSSDPDGDPLTYQWSFGDGGTATGMQPSHTYASAGTFAVTLTVTDSHQAVSSATTSAVIALANRVPTAAAAGL
ncbi:MAG: PKD domain-containing protein [Vicinamibacterales bacterium]